MKTWIVWPSNARETCEEKRVPEAVCGCLSSRMGDVSLHPEKDAMQAVLCTTPLLLRAPVLLQSWGDPSGAGASAAFAGLSGIEACRRFMLTAQTFSCLFLVNIQA